MNGSEKLPFLAIEKFAKPRCFKGVNSLPVDYKAHRKAWMVSEIEWVKKRDQQFQKQKRQVLFFVNNCTAHPMVRDLKFI